MDAKIINLLDGMYQAGPGISTDTQNDVQYKMFPAPHHFEGRRGLRHGTCCIAAT